MASIDDLRLARDTAERAHQDCLRRIRSYERLIAESDPRNEGEYASLLNRLHALEGEEQQLWFAYQKARANFDSADIAQRWGRGVQ